MSKMKENKNNEFKKDALEQVGGGVDPDEIIALADQVTNLIRQANQPGVSYADYRSLIRQAQEVSDQMNDAFEQFRQEQHERFLAFKRRSGK